MAELDTQASDIPASAICRRAPGFHLRRRRRHRGPCHAGRWRIADRRDRGAHARRRPVLDKTPAAATVLNGFGKSTGLVQVQELGVLETPIALTNTFGVGTVANAQIRAAVAANPAIGRELSTVNPLVFECNDGYLNDIQAMAVQEAHYAQALAAAGKRMAQGAVGAGRGMSCFSFKGGIGSASRAEVQPGQRYTVGALVLANFGRLPNLTVAGRPFGRRLSQQLDASGAGRRERRDHAGEGLDHTAAGHRRAAGRAPAAPPVAARAGRPAPARCLAMAAATSRWPFPPPTPCRSWPTGRCRRSPCCTKPASTRCSRRRRRPASRPSLPRSGALTA